MSDENYPSNKAIEIAAQCWRDPETSDREMDVILGIAFARRIDDLLTNATEWEEIARKYSKENKQLTIQNRMYKQELHKISIGVPSEWAFAKLGQEYSSVLGELLDFIAQVEMTLPPEAYYPKNVDTAVGKLAARIAKFKERET